MINQGSFCIVVWTFDVDLAPSSIRVVWVNSVAPAATESTFVPLVSSLLGGLASIMNASAAAGLVGAVVFGVEITGPSLPLCPLVITVLELFVVY